MNGLTGLNEALRQGIAAKLGVNADDIEVSVGFGSLQRTADGFALNYTDGDIIITLDQDLNGAVTLVNQGVTLLILGGEIIGTAEIVGLSELDALFGGGDVANGFGGSSGAISRDDVYDFSDQNLNETDGNA